MGFVDETVPEGYVGVEIEFTAEESEAIEAALADYAQLAGGRFATTEKVLNALHASALKEYAEDLIGSLNGKTKELRAKIVGKALRAQAKAYALHNLPIYLLTLAEYHETAGEIDKARRLTRLFLEQEHLHEKDKVDEMVLNNLVQVDAAAVKAVVRRLLG